MSSQILALLVMVVSFAALVAWVYWPGNKTRLEGQGSEILELEDEVQQ